MLRMIYKSTVNVPTTPAACDGTGSSVKRSENWSHPIPSIGLGRQTTTTTAGDQVRGAHRSERDTNEIQLTKI